MNFQPTISNQTKQTNKQTNKNQGNSLTWTFLCEKKSCLIRSKKKKQNKIKTKKQQNQKEKQKDKKQN